MHNSIHTRRGDCKGPSRWVVLRFHDIALLPATAGARRQFRTDRLDSNQAVGRRSRQLRQDGRPCSERGRKLDSQEAMPTKSAGYKALTAAAIVGLFAIAIAFTLAMYSAATPCSRSPRT